MALGAPQDPVFRVISQQMGNLAPRQAEEELELASSFPGSLWRHELWGKRRWGEKKGSDGGHQLWSTGDSALDHPPPLISTKS